MTTIFCSSRQSKLSAILFPKTSSSSIKIQMVTSFQLLAKKILKKLMPPCNNSSDSLLRQTSSRLDKQSSLTSQWDHPLTCHFRCPPELTFSSTWSTNREASVVTSKKSSKTLVLTLPISSHTPSPSEMSLPSAMPMLLLTSRIWLALTTRESTPRQSWLTKSNLTLKLTLRIWDLKSRKMSERLSVMAQSRLKAKEASSKLKPWNRKSTVKFWDHKSMKNPSKKMMLLSASDAMEQRLIRKVSLADDATVQGTLTANSSTTWLRF